MSSSLAQPGPAYPETRHLLHTRLHVVFSLLVLEENIAALEATEGIFDDHLVLVTTEQQAHGRLVM